MGRGLGIGYKNLVPIDSHIHSLSAKGVKSWNKTYMKLNASHKQMFHIVDKDGEFEMDYDKKDLLNYANELNDHQDKPRKTAKTIDDARKILEDFAITMETLNAKGKMKGHQKIYNPEMGEYVWEDYPLDAKGKKTFLQKIQKAFAEQDKKKTQFYFGDIRNIGGLLKKKKAKEYPYTKREKKVSLLTVGGAGAGFVVGGMVGGLGGILLGVPIGTLAGNIYARETTPTKGRKPFYQPSLLKRTLNVREDLLKEKDEIYSVERARVKSEREGKAMGVYAKGGKKLNEDWKKVKNTWKGEDSWITKDGNKMITLGSIQDRDGKNAFLYTAKIFPYRQALNPKYAKKSKVIARGRNYEVVKKKAKSYMEEVSK